MRRGRVWRVRDGYAKFPEPPISPPDDDEPSDCEEQYDEPEPREYEEPRGWGK